MSQDFSCKLQLIGNMLPFRQIYREGTVTGKLWIILQIAFFLPLLMAHEASPEPSGQAKGIQHNADAVEQLVSTTQEIQDSERARADELINHAAKTQEEFLIRVKMVWSKPEASMTEVAETITGVSVQRFNFFPVPDPETKYYALDLKYELHPDAPYLGAFAENRLEKAKIDSPGYYSLPAGVFIRDDLWLSFNGQTRIDNTQRNLCVTAGKTREILGEPTQMHLKGINFDNRAFGYEYIDGKRRMTYRYDGIKRVPRRRSPLDVVLERTKDSCLLMFTYEYLY